MITHHKTHYRCVVCFVASIQNNEHSWYSLRKGFVYTRDIGTVMLNLAFWGSQFTWKRKSSTVILHHARNLLQAFFSMQNPALWLSQWSELFNLVTICSSLHNLTICHFTFAFAFLDIFSLCHTFCESLLSPEFVEYKPWSSHNPCSRDFIKIKCCWMEIC